VLALEDDGDDKNYSRDGEWVCVPKLLPPYIRTCSFIVASMLESYYACPPPSPHTTTFGCITSTVKAILEWTHGLSGHDSMYIRINVILIALRSYILYIYAYMHVTGCIHRCM
jgi:hypothetical protein